MQNRTRLLGAVDGLGWPSEQSLASLWDLQAETSRKRQGIYRDLELRSGKTAVVRIHMATETREVDEVSLETKGKKKKSFRKRALAMVSEAASRQARSLRIQSTKLVTGGLSKRPDSLLQWTDKWVGDEKQKQNI